MPPETPVEETLAAIWSRGARTSTASGIDDDFFDLGGHSLLAVQDAGAGPGQASGWASALGTVFEHSTVRELAAA